MMQMWNPDFLFLSLIANYIFPRPLLGSWSPSSSCCGGQCWTDSLSRGRCRQGSILTFLWSCLVVGRCLQKQPFFFLHCAVLFLTSALSFHFCGSCIFLSQNILCCDVWSLQYCVLKDIWESPQPNLVAKAACVPVMSHILPFPLLLLILLLATVFFFHCQSCSAHEFFSSSTWVALTRSLSLPAFFPVLIRHPLFAFSCSLTSSQSFSCPTVSHLLPIPFHLSLFLHLPTFSHFI